MSTTLQTLLRPRAIAALSLGATLATGGWSAVEGLDRPDVTPITPAVTTAGAGTSGDGSPSPRRVAGVADLRRALGGVAVERASTVHDADGDSYPEMILWDDDEDGLPEAASVDTDLDGVVDLHFSDVDQDGAPESVGVDADEDGQVEQHVPLAAGGTPLTIVPDVPFAPTQTGGGTSITIGHGDFDVTSGAADFAALHAHFLRSGGIFSPSTTPEPYGFDSYGRNSDGDGYSDARDNDPTGYDSW